VRGQGAENPQKIPTKGTETPMDYHSVHMGMGQNLVPLVNIKIAGKWMFIPLKMYL